MLDIGEAQMQLVQGVAQLRPGDRVLVQAKEQTSREAAGLLKDMLSERFPDVEFTIVVGVNLLVVPGGE